MRLRRKKKEKFSPSAIDTITFLRKLREEQYRKSMALKKAKATKVGGAEIISGREKKSVDETGGG